MSVVRLPVASGVAHRSIKKALQGRQTFRAVTTFTNQSLRGEVGGMSTIAPVYAFPEVGQACQKPYQNPPFMVAPREAVRLCRAVTPLPCRLRQQPEPLGLSIPQQVTRRPL